MAGETEIINPDDVRAMATRQTRNNHKNNEAFDGNYFKWIIIGTLSFLAVVGIAFGIAAIVHSNAEQHLETARQTCTSQLEKAKKQQQKYSEYLSGDAAQAAVLTDHDVQDAQTVTNLSKLMKVEEPTLASCNATSIDAMEKRTDDLSTQTKWYETQLKRLQDGVQQVKASNESMLVVDAQDALTQSVQKARTTLALAQGHVTDQNLWNKLEQLIMQADAVKNDDDLAQLTAMKTDLDEAESAVSSSRDEKLLQEEQEAQRRAQQEVQQKEEQARKQEEARKKQEEAKKDEANKQREHQSAYHDCVQDAPSGEPGLIRA
ncbi:hypothetical protein [Bifidobacterium gallicum]|uniref:Erythrocyte binding protein n=1 Tax=Bifidobacterium gallicum DSM 20093 = LMG 11596 TaxID=561180 RepID=D1NUW8_9BIFI|nr:hypothetical protein [Bifidobacterium gallicum]EFA22619.1 hypothetical protein BIFGAL_03646 [Bifidobacterium gallicum DSM 20093 = LMG 11596]